VPLAPAAALLGFPNSDGAALDAADAPNDGVVFPDPNKGAADPDPKEGAAAPDPNRGAAEPDPNEGAAAPDPKADAPNGGVEEGAFAASVAPASFFEASSGGCPKGVGAGAGTIVDEVVNGVGAAVKEEPKPKELPPPPNAGTAVDDDDNDPKRPPPPLPKGFDMVVAGAAAAAAGVGVGVDDAPGAAGRLAAPVTAAFAGTAVAGRSVADRLFASPSTRETNIDSSSW